MKRLIICIISILLTNTVNCQLRNNQKTKLVSHKITIADIERYFVYKVDSINNYYLIYASKGDSLFKIVSVKDKSIKSRNVFEGKSYKIKLYQDYRVDNYLDVGGDILDDSTIINIEPDSIRTLSYAKNIKGLYIKY